MLDMYNNLTEAGQGVIDPKLDKICNNLDKFIAFTDDRTNLYKLHYMYDEDRLKQSKKDALEECLNSSKIFFYMDKKLSAYPRKAYIEHKKYFKNQIILL